MGHNVLELENIQQEVLYYKPQWVSLVTFLVAVLVIVLSAVTVGVFGYTYSYVNSHTASKGNFTKSMIFQIIHLPIPVGQSAEEPSEKANSNHTLFSSVFMSRLLDIGQLLYDDLGDLVSAKDVQSIHIVDT